MNILLTGATGYVGGAALRAAVTRGHRITAVTRGGDAPPVGAAAALTIDLADTGQLAAAAGRADAVLHCAASDDPAFLPLGRAAAEALIAGLPNGGRFAAHGGSLVFGDTGPAPVAPTTFAPPPPLAGRADADRALLAIDGRVRVNIVYGSLVYGGGARAMIPAALLKAARAQGAALYVGAGNQRWCSTHVDAFGALLVDAVTAENAAGGALFAAGGVWTLADAAAALGRVLGMPTRSLDAGEAEGAFGMFGAAFALHQNFSPAAALTLGWTPSPDTFETELAALANT